MLAYTYISKGNFRLQEKPIPQIEDSRDAIVRVTLGSICTSDLHIKPGVSLVPSQALPWATKWWESWNKQEPMSRPLNPETGSLLTWKPFVESAFSAKKDS